MARTGTNWSRTAQKMPTGRQRAARSGEDGFAKPLSAARFPFHASAGSWGMSPDFRDNSRGGRTAPRTVTRGVQRQAFAGQTQSPRAPGALGPTCPHSRGTAAESRVSAPAGQLPLPWAPPFPRLKSTRMFGKTRGLAAILPGTKVPSWCRIRCSVPSLSQLPCLGPRLPRPFHSLPDHSGSLGRRLDKN